VPVANGKAGTPEPFVSGWLRDERASGRPVDVQELPDGSLLISDDTADAIYRVSYRAD
jgi:glucose/arabinose dehydrogenase